MKQQARYWCSIFLATLLAPFSVMAQDFDLNGYLPYSTGVVSTLSSTPESTVSGFTLEIAGDSASEFHWEATHPSFEGIRENFRLDSSGLVILSEQGVFPGGGGIVYTQTFNPEWNLTGGATVLTQGQVINSSVDYSGNEGGFFWNGSSDGTLTVGSVESVTTPAGTFDALRVTFVSMWSEMGFNFSANGTTTQTWWMAQGFGIVRVDYDFTETYNDEGDIGTESATLSFVLESTTISAEPMITTQPPATLMAEVGDTVMISVGAAGAGLLMYQWYKNTDTLIPNATELILTLNNVQLSDAGSYYLEVSNNNGSATSNPTVLTVNEVVGSVNIPDANLEAALRSALNKPVGSITASDMESLTSFSTGGNGAGITDITGLEYAVNLENLSLRFNSITDLSPLAGLTKLISLDVSANKVLQDISPLANLTELFSIQLFDNQISDISPLANLTKVANLWINQNQIFDLSPLTNLTGLFSFFANDNLISDVGPLSGLTSIQGSLHLHNNFISDISPLAGFDNVTQIYVFGNFLDITPGSDDRIIIDNWTGTILFEPQNTLPTIATSVIGGATLELAWESAEGLVYQIQTSPDLFEWTDSEGDFFVGDGNPQMFSITIEPRENLYFRIVVSVGE